MTQNHHFEARLQDYVASCESQMKLEGWHTPDFDETAQPSPEVAERCRAIDTLLRESGVVRAGIVTGLQHTHPARTPIGKITGYHHEALLLGLIPDGAVRYPLEKGLATSIGYVGVRPIKENDEQDTQYVGPYISCYIEMSGTISSPDIGEPFQNFTNPFGLLRIRSLRFANLYLASQPSQPSLN